MKKRLFALLCAVLMVLTLAGCTLNNIRDLKEVPSFEGHDVKDASGMTGGYFNLEIIQREVDNPDLYGVVIDQNPSAGVAMKRGSTIRIYVGIQKVTVPSLIGKSLEEAENILKESGLNVAYADETKEGVVIDQDPKPDSVVKLGSTVTITIGTKD